MTKYVIKMLPINAVTSGMELGRMVLSENGKIVLSEGTVLTDNLIERLKWWDVPSLAIRKESKAASDDAFEDVNANESQKKFFQTYDATVGNLKGCFQNMRYFQKVPVKQMREIADTAIESLTNSIGVINHLHMVRRKDDYTFHHSTNVAAIAGVLGKWLGYSNDELKKLIMAGLLHDIGKSQVPLEILNKPSALNEVERIKMNLHPALGYELIKDDPDVEEDVKIAILQHHERMNGKGYPNGLPGELIHPFARVVAVADIYDAMTSDRVYRQKITPFAVVEMLVDEMFEKIDPEICTTFLNNVRDYFLGNIVQLNDGREAEVVYLGQFVGARPVVHTSDGEFIDLEKNKSIAVVKLLKG